MIVIEFFQEKGWNMNRYKYHDFKKPKLFFYVGDRVRPTDEWYRTHISGKPKIQMHIATIVKIDSNGNHLLWDNSSNGYTDIYKDDQLQHE